MNKIWIISDTHFNHDKMVEFCGRPTNHTEIVGDNLRKLNMDETDTLIHLGDICIGQDEAVHEEYIKPLRCHKWLLRGNHDNKSTSWYLSHGWDFVGDILTARYFGIEITFSHKPQALVEHGDINIHGHFHNSTHHDYEFPWYKDSNIHRLVEIETNGLRAVTLESIIKK